MIFIIIGFLFGFVYSIWDWFRGIRFVEFIDVLAGIGISILTGLLTALIGFGAFLFIGLPLSAVIKPDVTVSRQQIVEVDNDYSRYITQKDESTTEVHKIESKVYVKDTINHPYIEHYTSTFNDKWKYLFTIPDGISGIDYYIIYK